MIDEVKQIIQNTNFYKTKAFNPNVYKSLPTDILNFLNLLADNKQKQIWLVKNELCHPINYCKTCNKVIQPIFINLTKGFNDRAYCNPKCQMDDPLSHKKIRIAYKAKTGYDHPTLNPAAWELREERCLEKYGCKNHMQRPEVIQLREDLCFEKRGVSTHLKEQAIIDVIQEKLKPQRSENYQKSTITCQERYNVDHPSQVPEFFEKSNAYKWKDLILPSGKVIKYQGYENVAILELLKIFDETEITFSAKLMPRIRYFNIDKQKESIHFPDLFIPKENKFIEVKSTYTFSYSPYLMRAKQSVSKELGYLYEIWICSDKEVLEIMQ